MVAAVGIVMWISVRMDAQEECDERSGMYIWYVYIVCSTEAVLSSERRIDAKPDGMMSFGRNRPRVGSLSCNIISDAETLIRMSRYVSLFGGKLRLSRS